VQKRQQEGLARERKSQSAKPKKLHKPSYAEFAPGFRNLFKWVLADFGNTFLRALTSFENLQTNMI
jgi:hypothetical protein